MEVVGGSANASGQKFQNDIGPHRTNYVIGLALRILAILAGGVDSTVAKDFNLLLSLEIGR